METVLPAIVSLLPAGSLTAAVVVSLILLSRAYDVRAKQFDEYRTNAEADQIELRALLAEQRARVEALQRELDTLRSERWEWRAERSRLIATHDEEARAWAAERAQLEARVAHLEQQLANED